MADGAVPAVGDLGALCEVAVGVGGGDARVDGFEEVF